jgi:hypothetical protein
MAETECCKCTDVQSAAFSNHLACLERFWKPDNQEPEFVSSALQSVADHRRERPWSLLHPQSTDCTGCLAFILGTGVQLMTALKPTRKCPLSALSRVAAAGCVPCLRLLLNSLADETVSAKLFKQAVEAASRALKVDTLKLLFDAAPDRFRAKLQQCAFLQACQQYYGIAVISSVQAHSLLKYLLNEGCDDHAYTPLHTVLHSKVRKYRHEKRAELLSILLTSNDEGLAAALTKQDNLGRSVLHWAVLLRQLDELQMLLKAAQRLNVLESLLHSKDHNVTTAITLVRCLNGSSLMSVVAPYCSEVKALSFQFF